MEIRYTLDGSEPDVTSLLLEQDVRKVRLSETTVVRARAYRKGQSGLDCTSVSPVTTAVFRKQQPKPATAYEGSQHGLKAEYYEGDWKKAFVSLDLCDPVKKGYVQGLFDLSLKSTDADFAFSYSGYIKVPETGVYTFYAPSEYTHADVMEGYELNLYIDGELWYPATTKHAFGSWQAALEEGCHNICVEYADCRCGTQEFFNTMGSKKIIWDGDIPNLEFEGPGVERQMIGSEYLFR